MIILFVTLLLHLTIILLFLFLKRLLILIDLALAVPLRVSMWIFMSELLKDRILVDSMDRAQFHQQLSLLSSSLRKLQRFQIFRWFLHNIVCTILRLFTLFKTWRSVLNRLVYTWMRRFLTLVRSCGRWSLRCSCIFFF